jgi:hypothetical protein
LFAFAELSLKRSVGSTAGSTKGTMDSATLEQHPLHHYKRPYLHLANSVPESRDRCNGASGHYPKQDHRGLYCQLETTDTSGSGEVIVRVT